MKKSTLQAAQDQRRKLSNSLRLLQEHVGRCAKLLGCAAIDADVEQAIKDLVAEHKRCAWNNEHMTALRNAIAATDETITGDNQILAQPGKLKARIAELEKNIILVRKEDTERAAKEVCRMCRDGHPVTRFPGGYFRETLNEPSEYGSWPFGCDAGAIRIKAEKVAN